MTELEEATGARVAFLIRFGTGVLPETKTVIQAGDQVYLAAVSGQCAEALAIAALPPEEGAAGMKVAIAGAGAVGRSIARELVENSHQVTLIERNPDHFDVDAIPAADWRFGDACELSLLEAIHLEEFDVVIAATGDDKANVVLSLLAKTEFAAAAGGGAGQRPAQRVALRQRLGRRRGRVDSADAGIAGGGGLRGR